jgi:hypothetical protein
VKQEIYTKFVGFETTTGWERRNWIQLAQHGIQ